MTFVVSRKAYDAFMGRYADRLAPRLIAFADVQPENPDGAFTLTAKAWAVKGRA
jgi:hypothetical protein